MFGTIEVHGGKLVVRHDDVQDKYIPCYSTQLMQGDRVLVPEQTFYSRIEQPAIAIVTRIEADFAELHIATIRPCPFAPRIPNQNGTLSVGERLVVWLRANGSIDIVERFPDYPLSDAACIRSVYALTESRQPLEPTMEKPLYHYLHCVDHTDLDTFTIDPKDSVDFDDAISVDVVNHTIYVHIVDMAHVASSEEERERLQKRCLTLYLANEATDHLLDEENATSNHSLVTGKVRQVITVCMRMNGTLVHSYEIYKSIICVKTRYTYEEVARQLMKHTASASLQYLSELAKKRSEQVQYHLYLPAVRFRIGELGTIESIHMEEEDDAHRLIATAMIMTNMVVSMHLSKHGVLFPNRFHETLHGIIPHESMIKTHHKQVDSFLWVKKYARAHYAIDEKGHFGLNLKEYVHFTSPMRRYADVLIHRVLSGERFTHEALEDEIQYINRRGELVKSLQCLYTKWKIGRYIATHQPKQTVWITGVSRSGVNWYMPAYSLHGFAHVTALEPKQFWKWKEEDKTLCGKTIIRLGKSYVATKIMVMPVTYDIQVVIHIS